PYRDAVEAWSAHVLVVALRVRHPPRHTLVPYSTLFRSLAGLRRAHEGIHDPGPASAAVQRELDRHRVGVVAGLADEALHRRVERDRKSTRLNSSHLGISYAVFCLKKKKRPR